MAALLSTCPSTMATFSAGLEPRNRTAQRGTFLPSRIPLVGGLRLHQKVQLTKAIEKSCNLPRHFKTTISCAMAQPETLQTVRTIIAKQLSIDESTVTPNTNFADLGADSLDTVEIMMSLEENFGVSIGEEGAENIKTVQDAADLIEKVKAGQDPQI